jgi:hypothetical protein
LASKVGSLLASAEGWATAVLRVNGAAVGNPIVSGVGLTYFRSTAVARVKPAVSRRQNTRRSRPQAVGERQLLTRGVNCVAAGNPTVSGLWPTDSHSTAVSRLIFSEPGSISIGVITNSPCFWIKLEFFGLLVTPLCVVAVVALLDRFFGMLSKLHKRLPQMLGSAST